MTTQLSTIDASGKVELPRQMLDSLGLAPGTTVVLELAERTISIRQQSDLAPITRGIAGMNLPVSDWQDMEEEIEAEHLR
jgi:antitoxin component of MazEF toxin-antitoxin module